MKLSAIVAIVAALLIPAAAGAQDDVATHYDMSMPAVTDKGTESILTLPNMNPDGPSGMPREGQACSWNEWGWYVPCIRHGCRVGGCVCLIRWCWGSICFLEWT